jgi:hypothetical protein
MTIYTRNNPPVGFYVYMYLREDGTPYYVGKGQKKRAWESHKRRNNTEILPPNPSRIHIVEHSLVESAAHELERELISQYGRKDLGTGILRNLTDGGEGTAGGKFGPRSDEAKKKASDSMSGRTFSEEHKAKLREAKKGKVPSIEQRKKQSEALKGRKQTPEHIANAIANRKGKERSAECRAKISATLKAKALALKS